MRDPLHIFFVFGFVKGKVKRNPSFSRVIQRTVKIKKKKTPACAGLCPNVRTMHPNAENDLKVQELGIVDKVDVLIQFSFHSTSALYF